MPYLSLSLSLSMRGLTRTHAAVPLPFLLPLPLPTCWSAPCCGGHWATPLRTVRTARIVRSGSPRSRAAVCRKSRGRRRWNRRCHHGHLSARFRSKADPSSFTGRGMVGKITTREEKRDVQSVTGGFHRGFPLLSQSLAAAILHTTSKDYSQLLLQDCGRISMGYMFCNIEMIW